MSKYVLKKLEPGKKFKRVYHNYTKWEDYQNGMWRNVSKEEEEILFKKAVEFTGNTDLYGEYMMAAVQNWPYAMEHNLTASGVNKQAFVGHAACCIAINCPEHITRRAWWELTDEQRELANKKADIAIEYWKNNYVPTGEGCHV